MSTPEWIKYDGSPGQLDDITSHVGRGIAYKYGKAGDLFIGHICKDVQVMRNILRPAERYLICQPHPYADLIKIWADTGCPVWVKHRVTSIIPDPMTGYFRSELRVNKTTKPDWNIPGAEYRLTPFED